MEFALQFECASGGTFSDQGDRIIVAIPRRLGGPQRNQRVAGELDDITTPILDDIDDAAKIQIQNLREMLGAGRTLCREAFSELGESGDIRKQQRRRKLLCDRFTAA